MFISPRLEAVGRLSSLLSCGISLGLSLVGLRRQQAAANKIPIKCNTLYCRDRLHLLFKFGKRTRLIALIHARVLVTRAFILPFPVNQERSFPLLIISFFFFISYKTCERGSFHDAGVSVSWITIKRYFGSGTMTSSCFFVRSRKSLSSSCVSETISVYPFDFMTRSTAQPQQKEAKVA